MTLRAAGCAIVFLTLLASGCSGPTDDSTASPTMPSSGSATSGPGAGPSSRIEVEGIVSQLSGRCPRLSFTLGGERIVTDASTRFERVTCATLRDGARVEVDGLRQADGTILAREVELQAPAPPAPPAPAGARVELEGRIAGLSGACPNLSFTVRGTPVATNAATDFERITCQALANDMEVDIEGVVQNGVVLAVEVEPEEDVRLTSAISGLAGGCPNVSFSIGGERVVTTIATRFDEVTCGTLRNGLVVEVRGVRRGDGIVVATRIRREDD
ncbi:MAG TPA: DUF5666 domain-containing protein [Vicinamibacterales bacterium]|nr:DUF5666 domain-containing protein [Vicinamibacterales bacterium]